jgi:hypothetical protein
MLGIIPLEEDAGAHVIADADLRACRRSTNPH